MARPWLPGAGESRVVLLGASDYASPELGDIAAVRGNLASLRDRLTAPGTGLLDPRHCLVEGLDRPTTLAGVGTVLGRAAAEATDVLVVYYAGHGLLDDDGTLHLALSDTDQANLPYTGIPVSRIKQDLGQARARVRVLILDCCFSGRAIAAMATPAALVAGQLDLTGTYTLTSSSATSPSHAPPGARHTAFTDALLSALAEPEPLTLDGIYEHVRDRLDGLGLPAPQRRATNTAGNVVLVRGSAPGTFTSEAPPEQPPSPDSLLAQVLAAANARSVPTPAHESRVARVRTTERGGPDEERARVIDFWNTVELFSPNKVAKVDDNEVFAVVPGQPLPWEPGHWLARRTLAANKTWRHQVYLGVHDLDPVLDVLQSVFPTAADDLGERPRGTSALASFIVTGQGRPLLDSPVLSGCAWATGRLLRPGPDTPGWLHGLGKTTDEFTALFEKLVLRPPNEVRAAVDAGRPFEVTQVMGEDLLARCLRIVEDLVHLDGKVPHGAISVRSHVVSERDAHDTEGTDFLNSLIAEDLSRVAKAAKKGEVGAALKAYLRPDEDIDRARRVDIRERVDVLFDRSAPAHVPLGRWPEEQSRSLALGQQLAVAAAVGTDDPVLAVNGPPGTGKTTMLRDLTAALLVERAKVLAGLADPRAAFTGESHRWVVDEYTRRVHVLRPELTGFEMVVASSNNTAVENVTDEMPGRDAIDDQWRDAAADLDYFAGTASALLAQESTTQDVTAAWALLSARLGNKKNRQRFVRTFWFRTPPPQPRDTPDDVRWRHARSGLKVILDEYERTTPPRWADAVAEFQRVLGRAQTLAAEREQVFQAIRSKPGLEDAVRGARESVVAAEGYHQGLGEQLARVQSSFQQWNDERARLVTSRAEHRQFRPGFLEWLVTWGRSLREWREKDELLAEQIAAAELAWSQARDEAVRLSGAADVARAAVDTAQDAVRAREADLAEVVRELAESQTALGEHFPDITWFTDHRRRELLAPWTDPQWNASRTEVFLAALRLHKVFLWHNAFVMRQSLNGAMDVLLGKAPRDLPAEVALTAWQSLFLVVPVVSTTFSSFARMFAHLRAEALGWLLVDEAGQATPQSAVGALWRARRAVVVGDPLQLEPVVATPVRVEQAIRAEAGVDEQWLTTRNSVQRVADRLAPLGTSLPGEDGLTWVGTPLTVHRRCDDPMFSIANDIAYAGFMIHATGRAQSAAFAARFPNLPESKWIDVDATTSDGHWVPREGENLDRVLAALQQMGVDMGQVLLVSPFRAVANRLQERQARYRGLVAGTIHVAQGKQADIVILVLGGKPTNAAARRWAAAKPNLLNVAASRAKRRLYVIGNHRLWFGERHFDVLARSLPLSQAAIRG
ncbi:caspase, EACC1-associated type [Actinokineospora globicatena]|uniref:DNA helicase n=1 Tax=Actinokineospora globicatena TaxID=103729 RepID=A0A9W6V9P4_9PSEU|nr:AAA domain-containing protein [Actinokineospora globicatena]GLW91173.1 DNA helicase [Actinokineospora globicatena]